MTRLAAAAVRRRSACRPTRLQRWRTTLKAGRAALQAAFYARPDTGELLREHARLVDRRHRQRLDRARCAGRSRARRRRRLRPRPALSALRRRRADPAAACARRRRHRVRRDAFLGMLWDIGLEIGHSVRTIAECEAEMAADVTIKTSLLEHRWVGRLAFAAPGVRPGVRRRARRAVLLRGQDARAAAAAPQVPRHRVQPRAQRQGKSGRAARSADGAVDRARGGARAHLARARAGRPHHRPGGAHRVPPGRDHRRAARAAPLSRRPARGPAGVRPAERAGARARARRHARREARASS